MLFNDTGHFHSQPNLEYMSAIPPALRLLDKIVLRIAFFLPTQRDRYALCFVTRRWTLVAMEALWHSPVLKKSFFSFIGVVQRSKKLAWMVRELDLTCGDEATVHEFVPLLRSERLQHKQMQNKPLSTHNLIVNLAHACQRLQKFSIYGWNISDEHFEAVINSLSGLTELRIIGESNILTQNGIRLLPNIMSDITLLHLDGAFELDDEFSNLLSRCNKLLSLKLSTTTMTSQGFRVLGERLSGLKELFLQNCSLLEDWNMQIFAENCKGLETVALAGCPELTIMSLKSVMVECVDLVNLDVRCSVDSLELGHDVDLWAPSSKKLRVFLLENIPVTDELTEKIAMSCVNLTIMGFSNCPLITDDGILTVCEKTRNLRIVNFLSCPGISDITLHTMAMRYSETLRAIVIYSCGSFTPEIVQEVARTCSRLNKLAIHGSRAVSGSFVFEFATEYTGPQQSMASKKFCTIEGRALRRLAGLISESINHTRMTSPAAAPTNENPIFLNTHSEQPITPAPIIPALTHSQVAQVAAQLGLSPDIVAKAIEKVTIVQSTNSNEYGPAETKPNSIIHTKLPVENYSGHSIASLTRDLKLDNMYDSQENAMLKNTPKNVASFYPPYPPYPPSQTLETPSTSRVYAGSTKNSPHLDISATRPLQPPDESVTLPRRHQHHTMGPMENIDDQDNSDAPSHQSASRQRFHGYHRLEDDEDVTSLGRSTPERYGRSSAKGTVNRPTRTRDFTPSDHLASEEDERNSVSFSSYGRRRSLTEIDLAFYESEQPRHRDDFMRGPQDGGRRRETAQLHQDKQPYQSISSRRAGNNVIGDFNHRGMEKQWASKLTGDDTSDHRWLARLANGQNLQESSNSPYDIDLGGWGAPEGVDFDTAWGVPKNWKAGTDEMPENPAMLQSPPSPLSPGRTAWDINDNRVNWQIDTLPDSAAVHVNRRKTEPFRRNSDYEEREGWGRPPPAAIPWNDDRQGYNEVLRRQEETTYWAMKYGGWVNTAEAHEQLDQSGGPQPPDAELFPGVLQPQPDMPSTWDIIRDQTKRDREEHMRKLGLRDDRHNTAGGIPIPFPPPGSRLINDPPHAKWKTYEEWNKFDNTNTEHKETSSSTIKSETATGLDSTSHGSRSSHEMQQEKRILQTPPQLNQSLSLTQPSQPQPLSITPQSTDPFTGLDQWLDTAQFKTTLNKPPPVKKDPVVDALIQELLESGKLQEIASYYIHEKSKQKDEANGCTETSATVAVVPTHTPRDVQTVSIQPNLSDANRTAETSKDLHINTTNNQDVEYCLLDSPLFDSPTADAIFGSTPSHRPARNSTEDELTKATSSYLSELSGLTISTTEDNKQLADILPDKDPLPTMTNIIQRSLSSLEGVATTFPQQTYPTLPSPPMRNGVEKQNQVTPEFNGLSHTTNSPAPAAGDITTSTSTTPNAIFTPATSTNNPSPPNTVIPKHEIDPVRGRVICELSIEVKDHTRHVLSVRENDDADEVARMFCMHHDMAEYAEALIKVVKARVSKRRRRMDRDSSTS